MAEKVSKSAIIAFRLGAQHLFERADASMLVPVTGRCGIQNSPPGSALLALHARTQGITQQHFDAAIAEDKSLMQAWCMRGAPYFIPTVDAPLFTTGVLPTTEDAMRHFILGAAPDVDRLGMSLTEAVELTGSEISNVLSGRKLAIKELGAELAQLIAPRLPKKQREIWNEEGPHAKGQPLGEAIVHFCIRILSLQRIVCFAPRERNKAPFVLTDEWLGHPIPDTDPSAERAELLRRYLHCYGPSTPAGFAAWLGVQAGDTDAWWGPVKDELTPVDYGGAAWMLTDDLEALRSAVMPRGVRMLPPRDPYIQIRDRGTIVEKKYHLDIWKTSGNPGTVLADGSVIGTWRPRKNGRKLTIAVKTFKALPGSQKTVIQDEAEQIGPLRNASSVTVEFDVY